MTDAPQMADDDTPARTSLPSMLPPPWSALTAWFAPAAVSRGLPFVSAKLANSEPAIQMIDHDPEHQPALTLVLHEHARTPRRARRRAGR